MLMGGAVRYLNNKDVVAMVSQFPLCERGSRRAVPLGEMQNSCMWFVFVYLTAAGPSLSLSVWAHAEPSSSFNSYQSTDQMRHTHTHTGTQTAAFVSLSKRTQMQSFL